MERYPVGDMLYRRRHQEMTAGEVHSHNGLLQVGTAAWGSISRWAQYKPPSHGRTCAAVVLICVHASLSLLIVILSCKVATE